jgi:cobalt/nickel transport system ATP-binding protein
MTKQQTVLVLEGVSFGYPGRGMVLDGVHLQVGAGERVGIIGPNGSGKTTLFLLIGGILTPTSGRILVGNAPVVPGAFHPAIGMVFQHPDDQLFCPTVWDDVAFAPINLGLPPDVVAQRVEQALVATATSHLADRPPHHLSGGEKRMVAIAGVIAMQPQVILYDEPDAYLDPAARQRLIQFLQRTDQTVLIATHDVTLLEQVGCRVVVAPTFRAWGGE